MKVIGLTGGIGSGKSTVAKLLAEMGAVVMDADKVGHEVFQPGTEGWKDVVNTFGSEILTDYGEINRKKLAEIVFNNPEALSKLNQIIHPRAHDLVKSRLNDYRKQGVEVVVLEVVLLIEAKWTDLVDEVWVIIASEDKVVNRLKQQRGMSKEEILVRISSQMSNDERVKYADVVIRNDDDIDKLKLNIKELWKNIK
jgi:dephospho-CoA kinase